MEHTTPSVLCVDDNLDSRDLLTVLFEQEGFRVVSCKTSEECLSLVKENSFDAVVLDNRLGDTTSRKACFEIRISNPTMPIIYYSGESRREEMVQAFSAGANAYLVKPNDFDKVTDTVIKLIEESKLKAVSVN